MKFNKFCKITICLALAVVFAFTATACNNNQGGSEIEGIDMISTLSIDVGVEYTMQATLLPFGAEATIAWSSSDSSVATVSSSGVVKGIADGTAIIRAKVGGKSADCKVTVIDPSLREVDVTGVTLNVGVLNLEVNQMSTLTATVAPENATDKTVTWSTSDATVATVTQKGLVRAVAPGTAYITATSTNKKDATCIVRVAGGADDDTTMTLSVRKINELADRDDFIMGMDASAVPSLENAGVEYRDFDGEVKDVFAILKDNGITDIRIRIWNYPYQDGHYGDVAYSYGGGNCDVENAVAIAERCEAVGLGVIIDFHYSDFWADPGKQALPKAWANYSTDQVEQAIYEFTKESLEDIKETGVKITMVQIGNETTSKMAGSSLWATTSKYMNAGSRAVREVTGTVANGGAKVALHFTNPERANYTNLASYVSSVDYDVFGSSYYPAWHGTLKNLSDELKKVHDQFHKEVMVLETSFPFTNEDFDGTGNTAVDKNKVDRPFTVQGQSNQVLAVIETIAKLGEYGLGVCYWEGTWIAPADNRAETIAKCNEFGCGWASAKAGPSTIGGDGYQENDVTTAGGVVIDNQAFFRSSDGQVLESLKVFKLAKVGQDAPPAADYVYDTELFYTVDEGEVVLPKEVNIVLNDDSRMDVKALWEADASEVAEYIHTVDDYVVTGTTIYGGLAVCYIYVQNKNLLVDGSFEDTEGHGSVDNLIDVPSPWQARRNVPKEVLQLYVSNKADDAEMGKNSFHFWDSAAVDFDLYQVVNVSSAVSEFGYGTYSLSIDFAGGDCGDTQNIYSYVTITYKNGTTKTVKGTNVTANGWQQWSRSSVDFEIDDTVATIEVGIHVTAEAGGWGNIDNAQFFFKSSGNDD